MKTASLQAGVIASLLTLTAQAWAVPPLERGRNEYANQCASCHGAAGKGDGPLQPFLVKPPSDLTTLAQRHGGKLPEQYLRRRSRPICTNGRRTSCSDATRWPSSRWRAN